MPYPVPDPEKPGHYMSFSDVYGQIPTEEFIPSAMNDVKKVAEALQGCKSSTLTSQNVRDIVKCSTCKKPRCIYASRALTNREMNELKKIIKNYNYVCGCIITPESSFLRGTIFSRQELHCNKPIEPMFYGASKLNKRKDLCAYCAKTECSPDKELKAQFKTVHPICAECKGKGRKTITKGPLHTAAARKAAKAAER